VEVRVTLAGAWWLNRRGGRLYVWATPLGSAWLTLRWSRNEPGGVEFQRVERQGVEVFVQEGMPWRWIEIGMGLFPPGIAVTSDESRWAVPS
jgi:hypothetical protein